MLHRRRIELRADPGKERFPFVALVAPHADLDQLMGEQVDVDFVQHRRCEPVLADGDDRMQWMRLGAKRAALRGC